jgi:hypothetical protein
MRKVKFKSKEKVMKKFTQVVVVAVGLTALSAPALFADGGNQLQNQVGGNQLAQGATHWYEKAADTVAAADVNAKGGTVLALQKGSSLYLIGDSTLHQYQMRAGSLKGAAVVKGSVADLSKALKSGTGPMEFVVPVENFKSKETGLDSNAYKALKSDKNPEIKFVLTKESLKAGSKKGAYSMTAVGTLSIAGETAPVTLTADVVTTGKQIELKGVQKLKMSDYKVTPPSISLLVTAITCTDEIEIHYDVMFAPVGEANSGANK